jgi:hypothetical protein
MSLIHTAIARRLFLQTLSAVLMGPALPRAQTEWQGLFDGKSLGLWKSTEFGGEGEVTVEDGQIVLATGNDLTGITWTGRDLPTSRYEIEVRAMRLGGIDFFCGLTFPVQTSFCSLIVGGWSGTVIGLSSIDGRDAARNETTVRRVLDDKRWYLARVRVEDERIQVWLDDERIIDVNIAGRKIGIRPEVSDSKPLGIASWRTRAALKDIRLRRL